MRFMRSLAFFKPARIAPFSPARLVLRLAFKFSRIATKSHALETVPLLRKIPEKPAIAPEKARFASAQKFSRRLPRAPIWQLIAASILSAAFAASSAR